MHNEIFIQLIDIHTDIKGAAALLPNLWSRSRPKIAKTEMKSTLDLKYNTNKSLANLKVQKLEGLCAINLLLYFIIYLPFLID